PVQFKLSTEDVIHSFWVPSLGGKMDMIPGRTTHLSYVPQHDGEYLGICAEYCGGSHALMRLVVRVVDNERFTQWLENEQRPALSSYPPGREAFIKNGCISCHTVRGVSEIGVIGPDLTHFGSRRRIGAGILLNDFHNLKLWMEKTSLVKPEVKMPSFK